jgi:hypothetical protein
MRCSRQEMHQRLNASCSHVVNGKHLVGPLSSTVHLFQQGAATRSRLIQPMPGDHLRENACIHGEAGIHFPSDSASVELTVNNSTGSCWFRGVRPVRGFLIEDPRWASTRPPHELRQNRKKRSNQSEAKPRGRGHVDGSERRLAFVSGFVLDGGAAPELKAGIQKDSEAVQL